MKKVILLSTLIFFSSGCIKQPVVISPTPLPSYNYSHQLKIADKILNVELSDTPQKMEQGLSGRMSMGNDQGMLFDFKTENSPQFWMKDMNFSLDFIWIEQNKIVGITNNVPPPDGVKCPKSDVKCLTLYSPPSPVTWVLETNSGWAQENNLKIGDSVKLIYK